MTEANEAKLEEIAEIKTVPKPHKDEESIGEILKTILIALGIAVLLRIFIFQPFNIPSESMRPGLLVGDYLFVSKWDYGFSNASIPFEPPVIKDRVFGKALTRGDVVVFKHPSDGKTDFIKRVIGLPGDTIKVENGQVVLNGVPVPRTPLAGENITDTNGNIISASRYKEILPNGKSYVVYDYGDTPQDNTKVYEIPAGHYFMMGDNRDNSTDSRFDPILEHGVGYVPEKNIVGKARIVLFSWNESAKIFLPWTWFTDLRYNRIAKAIN